jgi:hypothetical protein
MVFFVKRGIFYYWIRPEKVYLDPVKSTKGLIRFAGTVENAVFFGTGHRYTPGFAPTDATLLVERGQKLLAGGHTAILGMDGRSIPIITR